MNQVAEQQSLIGFVDAAIGQVFHGKEIKGKDGAIVGTAVGLRSRKDIATALGLTGKDNRNALDAKILEQSDSALSHVKGEIAKLGGDWTLGKVAQRTLGSGIRQITVVVKEIKRNTGPSDEAIAKSLGWTLEQVQEARGRQLAALAANEPIDLADAGATAPVGAKQESK